MAKPHVFSPEGTIMLLFAGVFDVVDIILGILDFVVIGVILGIIWNVLACATIGVWLAIRTSQEIKTERIHTRMGRTKMGQKLLLKLGKRIVLPAIGNSLPLAKFFPFWVWSVWSALDKSSSPQPEQEEEQQEQSPQPINQPQATPAPA